MFVFCLFGKELVMLIFFLIICFFVIFMFSFLVNDFLKDIGIELYGVIILEVIYIVIVIFLDRMQFVNDIRKLLGLKVFEYFGIGQILEYDNFYVLFVSLNCKNEMRILLIMK